MEEGVSPEPGRYRLQNKRGCLRISQTGGYVYLRGVACSEADPIFSLIRDTDKSFTVRGKVVEGQSYCSTSGKTVPVGAPRVDYTACKVVDILPEGAAKKPGIASQQFRIAEIKAKPGWYRIISDAYAAPKCWDVSDPDMSDIYLRPCTTASGQQFQLLPATP